MAGRTRLYAVFQTRVAVEQLSSKLRLLGGGGASIAFVRRLNVGTANCDVPQDVGDLCFGKIGLIRHTLLLELSKERSGDGITRLDYAGRSVDEL